MKSTMKKILVQMALAAAITGSWTCASAAPIGGNNAKVALCIVSRGQVRSVFNPFQQYGSPIQYLRSFDKIDVTIRGVRYQLDIDTAVQEAMAEWVAAIPNLKFEVISPWKKTRNTWLTTLDAGEPVFDALGAGFRGGVLQTIKNPVLILFNKKFAEEGDKLDSYAEYLESPTMDEFLKFLLRVTVKHEIGHMLGFMHPPKDVQAAAAAAPDAERCPVQWVFDLPENIVAGPPIMAGDVQTTLRLMRDHFGRPVRTTDIQIAPQEAAVARAAFVDNCPLPPPGAPRRDLRALRAAGLCANPSTVVVPPSAAVISPLLADEPD